jgi:hypothetical protein
MPEVQLDWVSKVREHQFEASTTNGWPRSIGAGCATPLWLAWVATRRAPLPP